MELFFWRGCGFMANVAKLISLKLAAKDAEVQFKYSPFAYYFNWTRLMSRRLDLKHTYQTVCVASFTGGSKKPGRLNAETVQFCSTAGKPPHISKFSTLSDSLLLVLSAFLHPPASLCLFFGWTPDELVLRAHGSTKAPERVADGARKKGKNNWSGGNTRDPKYFIRSRCDKERRTVWVRDLLRRRANSNLWQRLTGETNPRGVRLKARGTVRVNTIQGFWKHQVICCGRLAGFPEHAKGCAAVY